MTCCRVTRQKYVANSRHSEVRPLVVPSPRFSSPLSTLLSGNFFTRLKSNDANCVKKHPSDASIEQHDAATRGAYKNQHSALKKTVPENEQRRLLLKKYKSVNCRWIPKKILFSLLYAQRWWLAGTTPDFAYFCLVKFYTYIFILENMIFL